MPAHLSAADLLTALACEAPFTEWTDLYEATADPRQRSDDYQAQLGGARAKTGLVESVRVGEVTLEGRRLAVVASEFAFLGGSIGERAARIITAALHRATTERLPVLASPISGGTRMQEGTPALLQLATIGLAIAEHKQAGLPYLVYLRSPTTGGVLASWASLGHVTLAQPGAFLAFLGPRVVQAITGETIPSDVQRAEHLQHSGVVDRVVDLPQLRDTLRSLLRILAPADPATPVAPAVPVETAAPVASPQAAPVPPLPAGAAPGHPRDAWADVQATHTARWPGIADLVAAIGTDTVWLTGPDAALADGAARIALTRLAAPGARHGIGDGGAPGVMVVGFRGEPDAPYVSATDLSRVRQAVQDAGELGLPVLTVIDLIGGELTAHAEEAGIAREIARTLTAVVTAPVPTVAVLLGKGSGGAAFAIAATDAVVALDGSWLAPLQPEGASAIVYRDTTHADALARDQRITAADLAAAGYVDTVVSSLTEVGDAVVGHLMALADSTPQGRHAARVARYRELGT